MKIQGLYILFFMLHLASCANHNSLVKRKTDTRIHKKTISKSENPDTKIIQRADFSGTHSELVATPYNCYMGALIQLNRMLEDAEPVSFKRAVYLTENAFYSDSLDYLKYDQAIQELAGICRAWMMTNSLSDYPVTDSLSIQKNGAIFTLMKDTIFLMDNTPLHKPFRYNFSDFLAQNDWSNQFVNTLLINGQGNCHSLPYLYKILADELQTSAYLSLAPNHLYIKQYSHEWGWYNTELTSGEFPEDAWIKASGYITMDAIRNGIYMDTLGEKQSIALCVYDLAKGYLAQTGNYRDGFVLACCDIVLKHHPANINAMILKAETLKKLFSEYQVENNVERADWAYTEMQRYYVEGVKLGYREMPLEMYRSWLLSISEQKDKYVNTAIKSTFKNKSNE